MFYVVTKEIAKIALLNGININKQNIVEEEDIVSELNKLAFEKNSAVLLKINDKMANTILEEVDELFVEPDDLELVDTENTKDDIIINSYKEITSIVKLASLQIRQEAKLFSKEYDKALKEAKSKNLKNAEKIAVMTAIKKVG